MVTSSQSVIVSRMMVASSVWVSTYELYNGFGSGSSLLTQISNQLHLMMMVVVIVLLWRCLEKIIYSGYIVLYGEYATCVGIMEKGISI